MTSLTALLFVLSFAFFVPAYGATSTTPAPAKCDAKVFVKLTEEAVADVYELYSAVSASYEDLVEGTLACVDDYTDFTGLVSCEGDVLTTWVNGLTTALDEFYTRLITFGEEIADDIHNCKQ